jgi:hypothetical protein
MNLIALIFIPAAVFPIFYQIIVSPFIRLSNICDKESEKRPSLSPNQITWHIFDINLEKSATQAAGFHAFLPFVRII